MANENIDEHWGFETTAIHAGQKPDPQTGAVTVPVYQTTTYEQDAVGKDRGYEYSRTGNPTRTALEISIAALEGAKFGRAFASGMAAEDTILRLLNPGDHIVMGNDAYGGTFRLISKVLNRMGVTWSAVDLSRRENIEKNINGNTRIVWAETPSNPLLA
ncbi:MAG: PLP-dependent transferase, partial [Actinomycetota bacterium]|nr:PLP-dependent transferase [Actinomycetota bacterium]